ncbi:hypothetical protein [Holospora undulata]|uniref:Uncharacterized protein n=1 Tax=Holospora undulata HU1 TaxID=1321371 RepID=A0A061JG40_9PROT|nr:hypothetical protein [Holospora undulata]ETZ04871.1 hypothetical protein K737_300709 [Holospora undulata HU1]
MHQEIFTTSLLTTTVQKSKLMYDTSSHVYGGSIPLWPYGSVTLIIVLLYSVILSEF